MLRLWLVAPVVLVVVVAAYLGFGRGGGVSIDGPVVAHDSGWAFGPSGGMEAIVGGVLEYQGGCLLLGGNVVVWPDGT